MAFRLKADTLRTFTAVHGWVGLLAGFALFVAFYAGAITVFHHELMQWQSPHPVQAVESLDDAQRLLDDTLRRHPAARAWVGMLFPGDESPQATIYWPDEDAVWRYATLARPDGDVALPHAELSELVNSLHYALGAPPWGTYLMGVVSLLYGVALISGVVIHLPRLLPDLFALRTGPNLKRFWQDAHNAIGVLSLPFHIVFAVTGAMLCLMAVVAVALNPLIYRGDLFEAMPAAMDTAPMVEAAGVAAPLGGLALWDARAREIAREQGLEDFEPVYLKLVNAGDLHAVVEITGEVPRHLGTLGAVALEADTGAPLATQLPGRRDANHATLSIAYLLHFGEYGNAAVRALYFLLGIGGAFLFYSGNLLWIESRRKRRQPEQTRSAMRMARATVGVCLGLCVAVSVAFVAAQVLEAFAPEAVSSGVKRACFAAWAACIAWAALRPPALAARDLLCAAALATALVPLAHGALTGAWWWTSLAAGHIALFAIDAGALALAAGFAVLARASVRRARQGDPHSVWTARPDVARPVRS